MYHSHPLVLLPAMGFPVTIAALLISIEPLIDMARTALNVHGSITAGRLTGKFVKEVSADVAGSGGEPQPAGAD